MVCNGAGAGTVWTDRGEMRRVGAAYRTISRLDDRLGENAEERGQEQAKTTMCCVGWMYRLIYAGRPQQQTWSFVVVPARPSRAGCCQTEEMA
jgi:hypothetical protein